MNPNQPNPARPWRTIVIAVVGTSLAIIVLLRLYWGGWTPPPSDLALLEKAGRITVYMTPAEVEAILGEPTSASSWQSTITTTTHWGYYNGRLEVGFVGKGDLTHVYQIKTHSRLESGPNESPTL